MTQFHGDIVAAIESMIHGEEDKVAELAAEISPVPLKDYLRDNHGKRFHGSNRFTAMSSCMLVTFDHVINNSGDTKLQLSWSNVTAFIRKFPAEIFRKGDDEEVFSDKNKLELFYNTFGESEIECPFWQTGKTLHYMPLGGIDFKCDYCESSFCEFDKLTEFLASHCHNYEDCLYYRKHKDDKSNLPCDNCGYDDNGCCNYPDTPDDYCVMGDKQIPAAPTETAAPAQNTFDYSELDADTAAKLENVTAEISNVRKEYIFTMAKKVAYAHDLLANHYGGKFGAWCESIGISRDTGNNLVRVAEIFGNISAEEQKSLSQLKPSLLYEAARPSAPAELVEQVKSGDITTHKEYIELKKQLEAQMQRYSKALDENHSLHDENQSLRRDRVNAMNRADNAEHELSDAKAEIKKLSKECERNTELEQRIKSLESQPRDVAVQTDPETERKFSETLRKLNLDFENFRDEADRDLADMRNQRNAALDRAEAAEAQLNAPKAESSIKPFLIKMTMDDFTALIKAVENDPYLKKIIQKAQVIRI
nr:MAG TPA: Protein of unknown function (DUF3102) [Caudoviricetes sp.]